jgi:putative ABC transport system permease protein
MRAVLYFRYMARESRGSARRLVFFVLCLAVGVAAVVSVAGLSAGMDDGLRSKARELLAADLVVEGRRPLPDRLDEALASVPGARRTDVREMVTVVAARDDSEPGRSHLAELKVVEGEYPFYGRLELEPDGSIAEVLDDGSVVVARELLDQLELGHGDTLRIGGFDFTIAGTVIREPDRVDISFGSLAPRVFLAQDGLARTGLEAVGSRIVYRALIRLPDGSSGDDVDELARRLERELPDTAYLRIETYAEAQPALRSGLERAGRFLGLVALLSLLIGGIGVGQTVRSWLAGRMDAIATLKCLGLRPREILLLYVGQLAFLGLIGSAVGAVAGVGVQMLAARFVEGLLPTAAIRPWQPEALLRGLILGVSVAVLFGIPSLLAVRQVPPARVFRRDAEPIPVGLGLRLGAGLVLVGGVFAIALVQSGSPWLAAQFTGALVLVVACLALSALGVSRGVSRLTAGTTRVTLRQGLAALDRPGAGTLGAIVALGLGVAVVLAMYLVESELGSQFDAELPDDAPTAFVVDIQPEQWPEVRRLLAEEGALRIESVAMVNARLLSVDGVAVETLAGGNDEDSGRKWVLTREQRLSYMAELPEDNRIIDGELWGMADTPEVSVEEEFARDMGARVGSRLIFDIQGLPIELTVGSIRTVDWTTFGINFFLVVEPGVLEDAPQFRVATIRLPDGGEQRVQNRLATDFPNVVVIPIREVLDRIVGVLRQAGLGVRLLGAFTVVAGILILGGVVSAGSIRRGREVALLKTLGMTRGGIVTVYAVEYALIGMVAGAIGAAGGTLLGWAVLTQWMQIDAGISTLVAVAAVVGTSLLAVVAGLAASAGALSRRPIEVLRNE